METKKAPSQSSGANAISIRSYLLLAGFVLAVLVPLRMYGEVKVDGTAEQRDQIANWLTKSLGTTVTIGANGTMSIANGGNTSATRLRRMINDNAVSVTLKIVENDKDIYVDQWQSSTPGNKKGKTTGTQKIDIADLKSMGNIINSYGFTPDMWLMHGITEVYEGKKNNLNYEDAHKEGIKAEKEEMDQHGCSWVGKRATRKGDFYYFKVRRPDGSFVVIRVKPLENNIDHEWFTERVPCNTTRGLIAIPDPDPQVHILNYDFDLEHRIVNTIDTSDSSPRGAAFDAEANLYVIESKDEKGEIRVFDPNLELINTITGEELIAPEGIEIDQTTGDIFIAVKDRVVKYSRDGEFVGDYFVEGMNLQPTDIAVWRNTHQPGSSLYGDGKEYDIYVTDRNGGKVYRFDVTEHINSGNFKDSFGEGLLDAPEGIYIDSWWSVWAISTGNNRVYRFTPTGELEPFGEREYFLEDTTRTFYDAAMVDFDGIYVVDGTPGKGALLLYDFDGNLIKTYGTGALQCPTSIAVDFFVDLDNLESIPDPGTDETIEEERGFSTIVIVGILLLIAIVLIYFVARRRK